VRREVWSSGPNCEILGRSIDWAQEEMEEDEDGADCKESLPPNTEDEQEDGFEDEDE